jgi:pyruvate formate lyase activating enzyme
MKELKQHKKNALIFNIQRFCLHDGPGIRTTLFFKGCPLRCAWCQNPESISTEAQMAFVAARCKGCFQCAEACGSAAILRSEEARIDYERCTVCGRCADVCPAESLAIVGRRWSVDSLTGEVLRDLDFFRDSGGGITLSGGEPLMQWRFLEHFLPEAKRRGVHVTLETSGFFEWAHIQPLLPFLDLIYFDLKHMDTKIHRQYTGAGNGRILDNFSRLSSTLNPLVPRMPIIPGVNDSAENIAETARFLLRHGHHGIHGLPYHGLGADKNRWINSPLQPLHLASVDADACAPIKRKFEKEGIHADIYD